MQTLKEPHITEDEHRFEYSKVLHLRLNDLNQVHNRYSKKWSEFNL